MLSFFMVQFSHPYMITGKTIALTLQTFRCLCSLTHCLGLSQLSFQGASIFNFMAAVPVHSDFGAQEKKICHCFHFSPSIGHEVMGLDAMTFVCSTLSFKPAFHSTLSPSSKGSLVPLHFLPLTWYHLHI